MAQIISVSNHKGGVTKSSSTANIGAILASKGKKVLLLDLDAQGNLTSMFLKGEQERSIYDAMKEGKDLPIVHVKENLDIVPSSLEMATIELELSTMMNRESVLRNLLSGVSRSYDYIFMDCPPSLGLVTINAMVAARYVYVPLVAEALPTKGMTMLLDMMDRVKSINKALSLGGIIIARWEKSNLSLMVEQSLRKTYGDVVFKTKIRKNISIAEAPLYSQDVLTYAPHSNGAKDYESLTMEILERTHETRIPYKVEEGENGKVTITDEANNIGITFSKGESMQRYTHAVNIGNLQLLQENEKRFNEIVADMVEYAAKHYPMEFAPIKQPDEGIK